MKESNCKLEGNTLCVTLSYNCSVEPSLYDRSRYESNNIVSRSYNIDNVTFEMRFIFLTSKVYRSGRVISHKNSNIYLVRFTNTNHENMAYNVKFNCNLFDITVPFATDNIWHIIGEQESNNGFFDINVEITVEPTAKTNPRSTSFASLYDDTELTDFELRGDEGAVKVHSAVLAVFSPPLRAMLERNWRETQNRCLEIPDISKTTLQHLKDYMYLDKLPKIGLDKLLLVASCYMIEDLEQRCTETLINSLTADNAMELSKFALTNNLSKLYMKFLERIESGSVRVKDMK